MITSGRVLVCLKRRRRWSIRALPIKVCGVTVWDRGLQHVVMVGSVQKYTPDALVVDELGLEDEI